MSRNRMSVRLIGDLPPTEELTYVLGVRPTKYSHRGTIVSRRLKWIQEQDVWILDLIDRDHWSDGMPEESMLSTAIATVQSITPGLLALDRTNIRADLYISTIRQEDSGGFLLPTELVHVAAEAKLTLTVSVLVMLSEEFDEDEIGSYGARGTEDDFDPYPDT